MAFLPDGEYDIKISPQILSKFPSASTNTPSPSTHHNLFQLKFSKYPAELLANAKFELYPRQSDIPVDSNAAGPSGVPGTAVAGGGSGSYMLATSSTTNNKELISEATALRAKESEYILVLNNDNALELCPLESIVRANKPRSTKKNVQELNDLRELYTGTKNETVPPKKEKRATKKLKAPSEPLPVSIQSSSTKTRGGRAGNKWDNLNFEKQKTKTKKEPMVAVIPTNVDDDDELNFDNFDQFNDDLSYANVEEPDPEPEPEPEPVHVARSSVASKKLPEVIATTEDGGADASFEDELEDELEQVFGDDDELDDINIDSDRHLNGNGDDGDEDAEFSEFEIDENPMGGQHTDIKSSITTDSGDVSKNTKGPMSLRDLVGVGGDDEDEDDFSEEE
ncbi:hypothetical protein DASC09_017940 [Saccharomycopsis crataegensis]|uniref:Transcription elongation factor Eaf N-terminal domain-containing protein n=1 Tax=Saccharomycopsis crataegensis TaxID=43959 RepID=A0AAV5QJ67_9ASCO|nr:hypothetical protein DASC09_017940 [Saccharomycopsis crataegensis]